MCRKNNNQQITIQLYVDKRSGKEGNERRKRKKKTKQAIDKKYKKVEKKDKFCKIKKQEIEKKLFVVFLNLEIFYDFFPCGHTILQHIDLCWNVGNRAIGIQRLSDSNGCLIFGSRLFRFFRNFVLFFC